MPSPSADTVAPTAFTWTAADVTNGNRVAHTGDQVVIARNVGASTRTITVTSARLNGRLATSPAANITAGQYMVLPKFPTTGWKQSDGYLYLDASHAEVEFAVFTIT